MKVKLTILLITIMTFTLSCQTTMMTEKYEWLPTESSPLLYPMNIYKGNLILEDGSSVYIPCSGVSHVGWGHSGSTHVQGEDLKPIPVKLEVTWASFLENKYYTGSWDLPVDEIKKRFKEGVINWDNKEKETYSEVVVGLAPGGVAVVWLYGAHQQIEVARFQAKETHVDIRDYVPGNSTITQEEYFDVSESVPEAYANMKAKGIEFGLWDTYRKKYIWRPVIQIPERKPEIIMMQMFNGEREVIFDATIADNKYKERAVPSFLNYSFKDKEGKEKIIEFKNIDEDEIFSIFKKLDDKQPIDIILKMDDNLGNRKLIVKQGEREYQLKKLDFENMWEN